MIWPITFVLRLHVGIQLDSDGNWITNDGCDNAFEAWSTNEPSTVTPAGTYIERCVALIPGGETVNVDCSSDTYGYVCKKPDNGK